MAEKFGGKYTLGLGILSTAIFTLLTPWAVEWGGATALIVLRVLMGLGEGTTFPAMSSLLAAWVPLTERSKIGSFVFGGGQVSSQLFSLFTKHVFCTWFFNLYSSYVYIFQNVNIAYSLSGITQQICTLMSKYFQVYIAKTLDLFHFDFVCHCQITAGNCLTSTCIDGTC